jgi:hypothetical protein
VVGTPGGDKIALMGLWSFADPDVLSDAVVTTTRRAVARVTGAHVDTIKEAMRRLSVAGWIRRRRGSLELAWMTTFTARPDWLAPVVSLGRVYAIEFCNGTVKVGMSEIDADARIQQHTAAARCFGVSVVRQWISAMHASPHAVEASMIGVLVERHASRNGGEFFDGGFDLAVSTAVASIGGIR